MAEQITPDWLNAVARLPHDELATDVVVLRGCLIRGPAGRVRLVVGEWCFEFNIEDVLDASERTVACASDAVGTIVAELSLRPRAGLVAVHEVTALQAQAAVGALPFAVAARPGRLVLPPSPRYAAAEARYMERHGLTNHDPHPGAA